jgi:hypothetical protein
MAGIHTNQQFATVDTSQGGMNVDTYSSLHDMLMALYYKAAVRRKYPLDEIGHGKEALCDGLLKYVGEVHEQVRQDIIRNYDIARLRVTEVWPFKMADSTALLHADRYYAFGDAGGLQGDYAGYDNVANCVESIEQERGEPFEGDDWSTKPEDLGGVMSCILTGRQYVDQLYTLGGDLGEYGCWSELPRAKQRDPEADLRHAALNLVMDAAAAGFNLAITRRRMSPLTSDVASTVEIWQKREARSDE